MDIEVELKGLDQSFQMGGKSDVDIRTGRFTHFIGKKVQDFFADYQGSTFNLGLGIGGTGYSYGTNKNGIVLRDLNATLIFPAPILLGLNIGLIAYSYTLKMTPSTDSIDVTFHETRKEKSKVIRHVDVQEDWDIQKLLETELRN